MKCLDRAPCGFLEQVREERVPPVGPSRGRSRRCGILVPERGEARKRGQGGLVLEKACLESWNWLPLDGDQDQVARQKQGGIGTLLARANAVRDGPVLGGLGGRGERDRGRTLAWCL